MIVPPAFLQQADAAVQAARAAAAAAAASRAAQAASRAASANDLAALQNQLQEVEAKDALVQAQIERLVASDPGYRQKLGDLRTQQAANAAERERLTSLIRETQLQTSIRDAVRLATDQLARRAIGTTAPAGFQISKEAMVISGVFTVFVLGPLAIAFAVRLVRRGWSGPAAPQLTEMNDRVRRIETAVETMAIEVERVSESQRYLVRTLNDVAKIPAPKGQGTSE